MFGVFGLGFFSYIIGASIDQLFFAAKLPSPTYGTGGLLWASLTLALLTVPVVIVATEEALAAVPRFPESGRGEAVAGGLVAPMPGTVLAVHVGPGDTVAQGQLLMIVEAMKMEHRITAPRAGTVGEVRARPGDQVNGGDLLAVLDEAT